MRTGSRSKFLTPPKDSSTATSLSHSSKTFLHSLACLLPHLTATSNLEVGAMDETPEAQIKRHIEDCATLLAKLECQLPDPALEWPVALLRHALEENRKALRQMN